MENWITVLKRTHINGIVHYLPSSKSLSNRALIINALSQNRGQLENLSEARDTRLMLELLNTPDGVIHVQDAGTVMRFLTAYYAVSGKSKVITGTDRMKERPIGELVQALRKLGAHIEYSGRDGFPPLLIKGFNGPMIESLSIRGDISSQFISALMMIAPTLPKGLTIQLEGQVGSRPYLQMTAGLMSLFGINVSIEGSTVKVPAGAYNPAPYRVEYDWSAASYWFAFVALAEKADILLPGIKSQSMQGDRVIAEIMEKLGVSSSFGSDGLRLKGSSKRASDLRYDFSDCPDLAQTILPVCAALQISGEFEGLESLKIKETDRIAALRKELVKIGCLLEEKGKGVWKLTPGDKPSAEEKLRINTYRDHRMAMGFAPWAMLADIEIENPDVVQKSYPRFWEDVKGLGIVVKLRVS